MGRVIKFMEKTNMKNVFCAGAGIQNVLLFLNDGCLSTGRELSPRTRIGPFHRPPYCLRQQGPTPADGPRRNSRPAGKGGRQVAVIQKKQYALDAGTCARKYAHHKNSFYDFYNAAQGGVPGVPREMITLRSAPRGLSVPCTRLRCPLR